MHRLCTIGILAAYLLIPAAASAHPIVPGFERFFTGDKADLAAGGQLLLGELNCTSCHQPSGEVANKQAPILDAVASRVKVSYLREFLSDPQAVKPGTTMPALFNGDPDKAAKVEALVHLLASTGTLRHEKPDVKATIIGRDLYTKIGCVACHGPRNINGEPEKNQPAFIVPLGDLKSKYTIASLADFLDNPLHARPSGRMPKLMLPNPGAKKDARDSRDIANFLLQGIKVGQVQGIGTTNYSYYEGSWKLLPDFSKLKPKATGTGAAFDISAAKRPNDYALRFEGYFKLASAGEYTFTLTSDDGAKLYVDGKLVVDNDGIHAPEPKSGKTELTKEEPHKVVVEFMNASLGAELKVEISGRGLNDQPLGAHVAGTAASLEKKTVVDAPDDPESIQIKPELVEKGKLLFASTGCANCHQLAIDKKPIVSTLTTLPLAKLRQGGCATEKPAKGLPDYQLSGKQLAAFDAVIKAPPVESKEPAATIARTMLTLNCYACHQRDKIGGVIEETNKYFLTVQPEMGDEGRVPPLLDGVGAKLKADYIKQILDKGAHDRPYMHTRMPGFGTANTAHLQPLFAALDKVPAVADLKTDIAEPKMRSAARHMVGEQALACIKCHTFSGIKAEGIQGIDMTLMPKRLNRDWFHFYMLDPQKYRPGTRMPSAFLNNQSPFPDILDGKAGTQIDSMWNYLSLGKVATPPLGLGKKTIALVPTKDAIIYRNFIEGAGARGIGVGYPEKVNLAFDANDLRMALIWQGAFIDAARHWEGRGQGYEGPLGDNILALPKGVPFAVLPKPDAAWPTASAKEQGYKFTGYRLSPDDRPTFDYAMNAVKIEDFPNAAVNGKDSALKRVLKLSTTTTVDNLYYRAAIGKKIEPLADGWYKIDGWKMKIDAGSKPIIRTIDGKMELLVPVVFKDGQATIEQEYVW